MDNNSKAGFFILGILGLLGIAALLTRRGANRNREPVESPTGWERVSPSYPIASTLVTENEERWKLIRGPDRLIEEIIIHRKVTQNG